MIGECELTGRKTTFDRDGRAVALLVSWDEYVAIRETLEISNTPALIAAMRKSEAEAQRGDVRQAFEGGERVQLTRSVAHRLEKISDDRITRALRSIEDDPIVGAPLFEPLRGLWTLREGTLRVIYRIVPDKQQVLILAIEETAEIGKKLAE